ncbi:DUF397 domain-containing protein [Streptomyces sp. NPDC017056]|uniref:DUF397 domain-containing protein n=1 Tax=Streptomyces sp. NPDC017056 TaxID=3364973 RepID=UPI0037BB2E3E
MTELVWQQSSFCQEGGSCLGIATSSDNTMHIRESSSPGTVVTTARAQLGSFIRAIKAGSEPRDFILTIAREI